jgi:hypothetical protein
MTKTSKKFMNIFDIIFKGILIYLKNFIELTYIMLFPVFGQLIGIIMIFGTTYLYTSRMSSLMLNFPIFNNLAFVLVTLILIVLPGFFVFTNAFWEYMVAMVSLNGVAASAGKDGKIKESAAFVQNIKQRKNDYITLLLVLALIWIIGLLLPLPVFALNIPLSAKPFLFVGLEFIAFFMLTVVSVYFSLSFQVFSFENLSPVDTLKKSFEMIEGNFWRSVFLAVILFILTGMIIPYIFQAVSEKTFILDIISYPFEVFLSIFMIDPAKLFEVVRSISPNIPRLVDPATMMSNFMAQLVLGMVVTAMMLPLGSACYTLLYQDILSRRIPKNRKK